MVSLVTGEKKKRKPECHDIWYLRSEEPFQERINYKILKYIYPEVVATSMMSGYYSSFHPIDFTMMLTLLSKQGS